MSDIPCDKCGKPAVVNIQDALLRWDIKDDEYSAKPVILTASSDLNCHFCQECYERWAVGEGLDRNKRKIDHKQLKDQLGHSILSEVEYTGLERSAILKHGNRQAVITLNSLDLYDVVTRVKERKPVRFSNIYADRIAKTVDDFFNFSLESAIRNGDDERVEEIEKKARNGEMVRIV